MASDFPYAMHVETIRKALWRPRSRAAVMVGSGFSRNADAITSGAPPFPLWGDVVSRLQKELDSKNTDPLRLAEEYEYAASRTALDDLLLEMIPDGKYQPGRLHELLLSLPWSDVFTANYDTLIERTVPKVHEIKYSVVLTPADIARSERPRIVKLHGSFPSHRPFIFTAEDYRKYPRDFAPFVNMVQQSIMENVFCMIGFSGNDPNFIQWIGWVRDQLGPAAPKIYLCDVLDMNAAKDRLYQSMRVVPIDLGPLVPRSTWTDDMRRPKALEWFLASLHQGKPLDLTQWPQKTDSSRPLFEIQGLPPPLDNPTVPAWMSSTPPTDTDTITLETLKKLVQHWRSEREGYPGWVVIPESNRETLFFETRHWLDDNTGAKVHAVLDARPAAEKLEFLHELVWRIRQALDPLPLWIATTITRTLERINPKPGLIHLKGLTTEPETPSSNTDELTAQWLYLAFVQINDAWQDGRDEDFTLWVERIKDVVALKPEWQAQWYFEKCWFHLLRLDESAVRSALAQWPEREGLPFWEAKRAAILATLGDLEDAIIITETSLVRVRQGTTTAALDYANLSQEGWIIALRGNLELAKKDSRNHLRKEVTTRLRELRRYHCNPMEDGDRRTQQLLESDSLDFNARKHGFDPGVRTRSVRYQVGSNVDEWVLLQSFHDGALPFRCRNVTIHGKGLARSMLRIWPASPRLAIGIGLLGGRLEELRKTLGRVDVSLLDRSVARDLYDWLLKRFTHALESVEPSPQPHPRTYNLRERLLEGCPEVISRLTLHLSTEQLEAAFEVALKMYSLEPFRALWLHDRVEQMFRRVLLAASTDQILSWLPRLLALPIPGYEGFAVSNVPGWPEPLEFIPWQRGGRRPTDVEKATWAREVDRLIHLIQEGPPEVRKVASGRLALVAMWGGLTERQSKSLLGALWSRTDSSGFPSDVGFSPWVLLDMPDERQPGEARRAVTRHLLEQPFVNFELYLRWVGQVSAHAWLSPEKRKTRIQWSPTDAAALLQRLLDWWARAKPAVRPGMDSGDLAMDLLGTVIAPHLAPADADSIGAARKMQEELEQRGISPTAVLPLRLLTEPTQAEASARRISRALFATREEEVTDATQAIARWIALAREKRVPSAPTRLLDGWVAVVVQRRQPGLYMVIHNLATFAERFGEELTDLHLEDLCTALEYLAEETKPSDSLGDIDELPLTTEERIALRWPASRLAASLASLHQQRGRAIPPIIEAWRNIGLTDTLPEVRWAWEKLPVTPAANAG